MASDKGTETNSGVRMVSGNDVFTQFWGDEAPSANDHYPFTVRMAVAGYRVTPRHSRFDYLLEQGRGHIEAIVKHKPLVGISCGTTLLFVFPERFMSVHEQRLFLHRLKTHPDVAKVKGVDIVTQNPLVVGGCPNGCLKLFNFPDDKPDQDGVGLLDEEMKGF